MVFDLEGEIIRVGKSKKTGQIFLNVLSKAPDGSKDLVTVFTSKDIYKVGTNFKSKVSTWIKMCNEV